MYTAAEQIEAAGGKALPIVGDIRDEESVASAVEQAVEKFGGIDIVRQQRLGDQPVGTEALEPKRYDLMQNINVRGSFTVTRGVRAAPEDGAEPAHPHAVAADLARAAVARPAHRLHARQVRDEAAARSAGRRSSREDGIASNALWPRTLVATAAVQNLLGGDAAMPSARKPEIYADAPTRSSTGRAASTRATPYLCEDVLREEGVEDLSPYSYVDGADLQVDLFVDHV